MYVFQLYRHQTRLYSFREHYKEAYNQFDYTTGRRHGFAICFASKCAHVVVEYGPLYTNQDLFILTVNRQRFILHLSTVNCNCKKKLSFTLTK